MRVWIDLSNSPHPLLFAPVARRLEELGHHVLVTARDNAQTVQLARERWPEVVVVGGESPRGRPHKAGVMAKRVLELAGWARRRRPDVALSHNSYGQIVGAKALGVPVVTAMDFEHQPANHLAFRMAKAILLPDQLPSEALRGQGAIDSKVRRYPGFKEELYMADFEPDPTILSRLGIERDARTVLVVVRPPPSRATYHHFENPLFLDALRVVADQPQTVCVILPRHSEQAATIRDLKLSDCIIPDGAVDSRSLMYCADLMLGAGGTMTREAAILGIPTWSLYAGEPPAVDLALEREGRIARLVYADQLASVTSRHAVLSSVGDLRARATAILERFVEVTLAFGGT